MRAKTRIEGSNPSLSASLAKPALVAGFVFLGVCMREALRVIVAFGSALLIGGCSLFAVADAAVTVVATTVKVGVKVVGAGVDAVIPDDDDEDDRREARKQD